MNDDILFILFFLLFSVMASIFVYFVFKRRQKELGKPRIYLYALGLWLSTMSAAILLSMMCVAYINHVDDVIWNRFIFDMAVLMFILGIGPMIGGSIGQSTMDIEIDKSKVTKECVILFLISIITGLIVSKIWIIAMISILCGFISFILLVMLLQQILEKKRVTKSNI